MLPEFRHKSAQQEVLGETHLCVRRHFKSTHFEQAESSAAAVGREEFVYAELGAMCVAAGINEQVSENAIHQPRRRRCVRFFELPIHFVKSEFKLAQ